MNNIFNLYNIELRRIYKWLLALVGTLVVGNILILTRTITSTISKVSATLQIKSSLNLMKLQEAKNTLLDYNMSNMRQNMNLLLGLCVLICLAYALIIWYRDVIGKSKTGYTLFMLPQNKMKVYIAKAFTVITMIYIVTLTQILLFIISLTVIKSLVGFSSTEITYALNTGYERLILIQPQFIDFIMINMIGVILAVIVIFTGVMIQKSFKISGLIMGIAYVIGSIYIFYYILRLAIFPDQLLLYHATYYIILFLVSIGISYTLLNKKVYI